MQTKAIFLILLISLSTGCFKPDAKRTMDVKSAVSVLESNGGNWTSEVTDTIYASLNDSDDRVKARGLVAIISFPQGCPTSVREAVNAIAKNDPDVPGVSEALKALSGE